MPLNSGPSRKGPRRKPLPQTLSSRFSRWTKWLPWRRRPSGTQPISTRAQPAHVGARAPNPHSSEMTRRRTRRPLTRREKWVLGLVASVGVGTILFTALKMRPSRVVTPPATPPYRVSVEKTNGNRRTIVDPFTGEDIREIRRQPAEPTKEFEERVRKEKERIERERLEQEQRERAKLHQRIDAFGKVVVYEEQESLDYIQKGLDHYKINYAYELSQPAWSAGKEGNWKDFVRENGGSILRVEHRFRDDAGTEQVRYSYVYSDGRDQLGVGFNQFGPTTNSADFREDQRNNRKALSGASIEDWLPLVGGTVVGVYNPH